MSKTVSDKPDARDTSQVVPRDTLTTSARADDLRAFRRVMVVFAVMTVVAGVIIGLFPLGIDGQLTRQISSALLLVGLCDSLVLRYWDRLFR